MTSKREEEEGPAQVCWPLFVVFSSKVAEWNWTSEWNSAAEVEKAPQGLVSAERALCGESSRILWIGIAP
jgi:hypothetical protein